MVMLLQGTFQLSGKGKVFFDFWEDFSFQQDFLNRQEVIQPKKPMNFEIETNSFHHRIEIHYKQGLYPIFVCSCQKAEDPCEHVEILKREVFPSLLQKIYQECGSEYNHQYLNCEVAQKIRLVSPLSERKILEGLRLSPKKKER